MEIKIPIVLKKLENSISDFEYQVIEDLETSEKSIIDSVKQSSVFNLMKSFDGLVSHVKQWANPIDKSRWSKQFNMHTDWLYYKDVPEIIWLYCIDSWKSKATTFVIDTKKVIWELLDDELDMLKKLQYSYIGRDWKFHSRPAIENDPLSWAFITNMSAKWFISPYPYLWAKMPDMFDYIKLVKKVHDKLSSSIKYEHFRKKWDLLLVNNNRYLHWRNWWELDLNRHLLRFRLNVDASRI